jgi:ATP-dependent exoDNAse (exonuclease V) beta subunit
VVWWDPHVLALDAASTYGLRRDDLIVKDGDMFAVAEHLATYERWKEEKSRSIASASKKSIDFETASAWASSGAREQALRLIAPEPQRFDIAIVDTPIDTHRPHGRRFGTLVHAVLAAVALDARQDDVRAVAVMQARILGANAEEVEAAVRTAVSVLAHPLLQRARAASATGQCHREMPVTWRAADGGLVEGTIDLSFDDEQGATVVDFKTDVELDRDVERYRRQLTIYCRALEQLRGGTVQGVILRV